MKPVSRNFLIIFTLCVLGIACEEFTEIDPPRTDLTKQTVFASDATAEAAVVDLYYQQTQPTGFASGGNNSISLLASLSADDLNNGISWNPGYQQFNENAIIADNSLTLSIWSDLYKCIYKANAILEGLDASATLSEDLEVRLRGEALFMRAFCYFYLVNLYGDVPLITTTDYIANKSAQRNPVSEVYDAISHDLGQSIDYLPDNYDHSGSERVRVNKWAATELLARVHLYNQQWPEAESRATEVINSPLYAIVPLDEVYRKNNPEAIWQFVPNIWGNAWDVETFLFYGHSLRSSLVDSFESVDMRKARWIENGVVAPYDYPVKYKDYQGTGAEYSTVLRLAEQYLIRAEARAMQDRLTGAESAASDINVIRNRAGLADTQATDVAGLMTAIESERRAEFFTEWGHRWLDLKRWNRADEVLAATKGTNWQSTDKLYPIPEFQIMNSGISQNPGY